MEQIKIIKRHKSILFVSFWRKLEEQKTLKLKKKQKLLFLFIDLINRGMNGLNHS